MSRWLVICAVMLWSGAAFAQAPVQVTGPIAKGDTAIFNSPTIVQGSSSSTNPTIYNNDQLFGSGRPWCDVRSKGAIGDGVTNDHAAIAACISTIINLQPTIGSGIVYFPIGHYCDFAGEDVSGTPLNGIEFLGAGRFASTIDSCGHNVTPIKIGGDSQSVRHMTINGYNNPAVTAAALAVGSGCNNLWTCVIDDVVIGGGLRGIDIEGGASLTHVRVNGAYGDYIYTAANTYINNSQIDTPALPGGCSFPSANSLTINAWASSTSYSQCTIVSIASGAWWIIATSSGTHQSGGSQPSVAAYGVPIVDNAVTWQLVGPAAGNGLDVNAATDVFVSQSDVSGTFNVGAIIQGGSNTVTITDSTFGESVGSDIEVVVANNIELKGNYIPNCLSVNCVNVQYAGSFPGDTIIIGNTIQGGFVNLSFNVGGSPSKILVEDNIFGNSSIGVYFAPTSGGDVNIVSNSFGSETWGAVTTGVDLVNAGTDYIRTLGNICHGATTCVSNSSTGAHNFIETTPGILNGASSISGGTAANTQLLLQSTSSGSPSGDQILMGASVVYITPVGGSGPGTLVLGDAAGTSALFGNNAAGPTFNIQSTSNGSPSGDTINIISDQLNFLPLAGTWSAGNVAFGNGSHGTGGLTVYNATGHAQNWVPGAGTTPGSINFPAISGGGSDTAVTLAAAQSITGKNLDNSPIGATTPSTGKFTSLNASGQITSTAGLPTITSGNCGTGTNGAVVSGSTNQSGQITIGAAATTTCTISWSTTLATAPSACVFFPMNATAAATGTTVARVGAPSTGSVVLTGSALANANYAYLCL